MDSSFLNFGMDPNSDSQRQSSNANLNEMWNSIGQDTQMQQMPLNPFSAMTADMMNFSNASPSDGDSNTNTSSTATSSNADGVTVAKTEAKGTGSAKRSAAVKTGSSKSSSSSSSKLKNSALTEAEKIARREKHNQVEIRRRKRINQRFNELGDICGCDSKQKRNILTSAIDKLKEYEERIQQLKSNLESLALDDAAAAENGDNSESGDAPAEVKQEGDVLPFVPSEQSVVDHRSVFMKSGVPLHVSGFDGRILDCNEKFAQLFGFTREVILANQVTVFSLTSPDSLAVTFGVVGHLMKGNPRAQVDNLMIGPQGRLIKVKVTAWLIRDNGRPKYFMSMMVPDPNFQPPTMTSAPSTASNFLTAPPQQQSVLPGPGPLSQPQQSSPPQQQLPNQAPQNPQSGLLLQQHLQQLQQGHHAVQLQQLQQQLQQVQNQQQQQQQQQGGGVNPTQNILPYPSSNVNPTLAPNPQTPQQLPPLQPQQLQQPNSGGQVPPQGQLAQLQQLQQREQQLQQLAHLQQLTMQLQQQQHQQQQQQQQQAQKKPQQPQAPARK